MLNFKLFETDLTEIFICESDSITTTVFCAILNVAYSPSSKVRILKSIPMVEINVGLNALSANRNIIQVLPTPLSPIRSSLKNKSKFFCAAILYNQEVCFPVALCYNSVYGRGKRSGYQTSVTSKPEPEVDNIFSLKYLSVRHFSELKKLRRGNRWKIFSFWLDPVFSISINEINRQTNMFMSRQITFLCLP